MGPVEAEGDSIDAAIAEALRQLGVERDRVELEILQNATRGLFGFGGRKAKVRATVRRPITDEPLPESPPEPEVEKAPAVRSSPPAAAEPSGQNAAVQRAQDVLQNIVDLMGVEVTVSAKMEDEQIILELDGDSSGVLIGRKGQMLDALEYVIARIVGRDEKSRIQVVVDSQSYRTRRMEALESLARRMGAEAKRKGSPVTLNAMSPRDRRIVHMILQRDTSLVTRSSGKGYYRKLVILPATSEQPPSANA